MPNAALRAVASKWGNNTDSVSIPVETEDGDFLLWESVHVPHFSPPFTVNPPAGWTILLREEHGNTWHIVLSRVWHTGDPTSYTFSVDKWGFYNNLIWDFYNGDSALGFVADYVASVTSHDLPAQGTPGMVAWGFLGLSDYGPGVSDIPDGWATDYDAYLSFAPEVWGGHRLYSDPGGTGALPLTFPSAQSGTFWSAVVGYAIASEVAFRLEIS